MTDWRDLPSGPKLDALVAERVLGWTLSQLSSHPDQYRWIGPNSELPDLCWRPRCGVIFPTESPSTTWAGAGLVVEAMDERGFTLVLYRLHARVTWKAEFSSACCQEASTAPLAIAKAALAALEAE